MRLKGYLVVAKSGSGSFYKSPPSTVNAQSVVIEVDLDIADVHFGPTLKLKGSFDARGEGGIEEVKEAPRKLSRVEKKALLLAKSDVPETDTDGDWV